MMCPERYANAPSTITIGTDTSVSCPSSPSVRLAPFDTAVTMKIATTM